MSKKTPAKLSRRQREEQRQMRRWMIIGGGAFAAVAAGGVGMTFLPPSFPSLSGAGTLEDRISSAGIGDNFVKLSDGPTVALAIGTTDCSFCRDFVAKGLVDLAEFAGKQGIGLVYASTGSSPTSLGSTKLISGFAKAGVTDPKMVQAVYDVSSSLGSEEGLAEAAKEIGSRFDVSASEVAEIIAKSAIDVTQDIQTLGRTFPINGTPIFFVQSTKNEETINWFSGWPGSSGLRRQVETARSA